MTGVGPEQPHLARSSRPLFSPEKDFEGEEGGAVMTKNEARFDRMVESFLMRMNRERPPKFVKVCCVLLCRARLVHH